MIHGYDVAVGYYFRLARVRENKMTPLFLGQSLLSHLLVTGAVSAVSVSFGWFCMLVVRHHIANKDDETLKH